MSIFKTCLFIAASFSFQLTVSAQDNSVRKVSKRMNNAQKSFVKTVEKSELDPAGKSLLKYFATTQMDSLQELARADKNLPAERKILALNSQTYFLQALQAEITAKKFETSLIRDSRDQFMELWNNYRLQQLADNRLANAVPQSMQYLAAAFRDYPQSGKMQDLTKLKTLERSNDKILQFLATNPNFSYRDSLIFISGNSEPEKLVRFITQTKDEQLQQAIRQHSSPIVQTLVTISKERNLENYLPFVGEIAQGKITLAEVDRARAVPSEYFKLLVDAEIVNQQKIDNGQLPVYRKPLRAYLKKYAIQFFTDVINSLHEESSEKARYFVLEGMRPQDLYYILISGENDIYTSSYLYTYKKLMAGYQKNNADQLFELTKYDRYRKFMLLAGRYNMLSSFLKEMPKESSVKIMKKFIGGLEENNNGLEEIINVAETFPGIVKDAELSALTYQEIKSNYNRCRQIPNLYGTKVYTLLEEIFNAVKNNELGKPGSLPPALQVYYKIPHKSLKEKNGRINQLVLFYGDEDGKGSYSSFMGNFTDAAQWNIEKNDKWVTITSKKLQPMTIYANLPLNYDEGLDVKAQEALKEYLKAQGINPRILIHRGHSYHLSNSIKSVTANTQLAILGSCGGYTEIFEVLDKSPDAQVISTKQIGSREVNEPIIRLMNEKLLNQQDLAWSDMWQQLDTQLKNRKTAYDYFQEYVPPYKNIALLVATLYHADATMKSQNPQYATTGN